MKLRARWHEFGLLILVAVVAGLGTFYIYFTSGQERQILFYSSALIGLLFLSTLFFVSGVLVLINLFYPSQLCYLY